MLAITKKCEAKNGCGKEITVIIPKKDANSGIYTWVCPNCGNYNGLFMALAKRSA